MAHTIQLSGPWTALDRSAVRAAMVAHRHHTQKLALPRLRELGAGATQSSLSNWLSDSKPRSPHGHNRFALSAYVAESFPDGLPEPPVAVGSPQTSPTPISDDLAVLDETTRDVTGEPLLGDRQGALVDAATARLDSGVPMSDADERVYLHQCRILRLDTGDLT